MAEFNKLVVTDAGLKLEALSRANEKSLVFTKMVIGDSRPDSDSDIPGMTKVVSERLSGDISNLNIVENADTSESRYAISGRYGNTTLDTGFYVSEVGVYAKVDSNYYTDDSWNGYAGEEVLYGYAYAPEGKADWLPSKDTPMDSLTMTVYMTISNASTVSVYVQEETTVDVATFKAHLTDVNAHRDMVGCTSTGNGVRGMVPKPVKGQQDSYLSGDGTWKEVPKRSIKDIIDIVYPVGWVIETKNSDFNPNTAFPGTVWERFAPGRVRIGAGTYTENGTSYSYAVGDTGGEAKHTLTASELASHSHSASSAAAGGHTHTGTTSWGGEHTHTVYGAHIGGKAEPGWSRHAGQEYYYGNNTTSSSGGHNHSFTTSAAGAHTHTVTVSATGGNGAHENRQPYVVVACWLRTA